MLSKERVDKGTKKSLRTEGKHRLSSFRRFTCTAPILSQHKNYPPFKTISQGMLYQFEKCGRLLAFVLVLHRRLYCWITREEDS